MPITTKTMRSSFVGFLVLPGMLMLLAPCSVALAKKGKGGGEQNEALHGCITFRDQEAAPRDRVRSDGWGQYCDTTDAVIGLLGFFQFQVDVVDNRSLTLEFDEMVYDPNDLPAQQEFWTISIPVSLDEMRSQEIGVPVKRDMRLRFGKQKDVALVLFGGFGFGDQVSVTRIGEDQWTIEAFPSDNAVLARQGKGNANFIELASGSMPFQITYNGAP